MRTHLSSLSGRIKDNVLSHFADFPKFSIVNLYIFLQFKINVVQNVCVYTQGVAAENTPESLPVACLGKFQA